MPEYREGPEAKEKFERTMKTLFQAPKLTIRKKKKGIPPAFANQSVRTRTRTEPLPSPYLSNRGGLAQLCHA